MHDTNKINTSKSPRRADKFVCHAIAYICNNNNSTNIKLCVCFGYALYNNPNKHWILNGFFSKNIKSKCVNWWLTVSKKQVEHIIFICAMNSHTVMMYLWYDDIYAELIMSFIKASPYIPFERHRSNVGNYETERHYNVCKLHTAIRVMLPTVFETFQPDPYQWTWSAWDEAHPHPPIRMNRKRATAGRLWFLLTVCDRIFLKIVFSPPNVLVD